MCDMVSNEHIFRTGLGPKKAAVNDLYEVIVTQARRPFFYTVLGVPDTANGCYDVIMLHAYVVMKRLKAIGASKRNFLVSLIACLRTWTKIYEKWE